VLWHRIPHQFGSGPGIGAVLCRWPKSSENNDDFFVSYRAFRFVSTNSKPSVGAGGEQRGCLPHCLPRLSAGFVGNAYVLQRKFANLIPFSAKLTSSSSLSRFPEAISTDLITRGFLRWSISDCFSSACNFQASISFFQPRPTLQCFANQSDCVPCSRAIGPN
jgi:hypothetical protein